MILIAESGSSKTKWILKDETTDIMVETRGINPFFATEEFIYSELNSSELESYRGQVQRIVFFGAGCSHEDRNNFLKTIFGSYFQNAKDILVEHDMLAAGIALFGHESGIACIIGTGSNSCVFENGKVVQNVPALGYILGDEASGAYIGKEILRHYIYKTLPKEIYDFIHKKYAIDKEDIFEAVYKKPLPNRYLASFATVASEFRGTAFIQHVLSEGFNVFIKYHILCYPESKNYPIGFVGSIAAVFEEELQNCMTKHGLTVHKIENNPIQSLARFYI